LFEFLINTYILHWEPSRAIWIGGHTLSWDARCSGIYIGFGIGVLYQVAIDWKMRKSPSANFLLTKTIFLFPLFFDVFTIRYGLRAPSNDMRYLTGLFFGEAFSAYLYPAFIIMVSAKANDLMLSYSLKRLALPLILIVFMFFLKEWNNVLAFGILELTGIAGFLSLFGILAIGMLKAFINISSPKTV